MPEGEANPMSLRLLLPMGILLATILGAPMLGRAESSAATATAGETGRHLRATYLANEGFLLESGEHKVLVDALFPGLSNYPRVIGPLRDDLLAARPPFSDVKVALATHYHDDHFGPGEALAFLGTSLETTLVSTPQAIARFAEVGGLDDRTAARVWGIYPAEGRSKTLEFPGVSIDILNLHHGRGRRPQVENLGFVIDLNGFRILHVGDTEAALEDFKPYGLDSRSIDLALLPGWFLAEPDWVAVARSLGARNLVAMHLAEESAPPSWFGSSRTLEGRRELIRNNFPGVWIPRDALDSRLFERDAAPSGQPR